VFNEWNKKLSSTAQSLEPIDFQFGPAYASHYQGSVESMVKLSKNLLGNMLAVTKTRMHNHNDFSLRTMLCEVMNIINSRPLEMTPMSDTENDFLTANHFLTLRQNNQLVPVTMPTHASLTNNWTQIQYFVSTFLRLSKEKNGLRK
jgi:hypothetical protein